MCESGTRQSPTEEELDASLAVVSPPLLKEILVAMVRRINNLEDEVKLLQEHLIKVERTANRAARLGPTRFA